MLWRLREHLGTAGLVVAIVALIAALAGGAIAANGGSGDGKATASAKAKRGKPGPKGPKGDTGPAGPAGPAGAKGDKGDAGAAGSNGTNGTNGSPGAAGPAGTSVTNTALAKGNVYCPEGGAEFKVGAGTPTRVCIGATASTETLPPGETETGIWSIAASTTESLSTTTPISFPVPLAAPGAAGSAKTFSKEQTEKEEFTAECPGTLAEPDAAPGFLCIYTAAEFVENGFAGFEARTVDGEFATYGVSGAVLWGPFLDVNGEGQEADIARTETYGSWAVTAPVTP